MKKQFCLNRRLQELDLSEQNFYLGNKINNIKPIIDTNIPNYSKRKNFINSFSKKQSKYIYNKMP